MKRAIVMLLAVAASMVVAQLPATAQNRVSPEGETSQREQLLAPHISHVRVRATLLHWGMSQADIARAMAAPSQVDAADEGSVRVLRYSAEPIATTVTITDGKLSGVALDVAGVDDPALPNFTRLAWLGMDRATVLRRLGMPAENHLRNCDGMNVEQMIFERPGGPNVSIFLIDGRVAAKKVGTSFPVGILGIALPLAPDPAEDESDEIADRSKIDLVAVGMNASELQALFGPPKLQVPYTFKGHAAEHAIYETSPGKSFGSFTLVDGVLIDFAQYCPSRPPDWYRKKILRRFADIALIKASAEFHFCWVARNSFACTSSRSPGSAVFTKSSTDGSLVPLFLSREPCALLSEFIRCAPNNPRLVAGEVLRTLH